MKHLQHLIVLIIFASIPLQAMYPQVFVLQGETIQSDGKILNNPEKKPVFRIKINDDFEKEIMQRALHTHGIQHLHNAMDNVWEGKRIDPIILNQNTDILTRTSARIAIQIVFNEQDKTTDILTHKMFDFIYKNQLLKLLPNISYCMDKQNKQLHIKMLVFAELYEYLPYKPTQPIPIF